MLKKGLWGEDIFILGAHKLTDDHIAQLTDSHVHTWDEKRKESWESFRSGIGFFAMTAWLCIAGRYVFNGTVSIVLEIIGVLCFLAGILVWASGLRERNAMRHLKRIAELELPADVEVLNQDDLYWREITCFSTKELSWSYVRTTIEAQTDLGKDLEAVLRRELHATRVLRAQRLHAARTTGDIKESDKVIKELKERLPDLVEILNAAFDDHKEFDRMQHEHEQLKQSLRFDATASIESKLTRQALDNLPPVTGFTLR